MGFIADSIANSYEKELKNKCIDDLLVDTGLNILGKKNLKGDFVD